MQGAVSPGVVSIHAEHKQLRVVVQNILQHLRIFHLIVSYRFYYCGLSTSSVVVVCVLFPVFDVLMQHLFVLVVRYRFFEG